MALVYNNVRPLDISYNGTQINELKYDGQGVWGRPFPLSITQGTNTTLTVERKSSPNQDAELGMLSDGSTIYYGDTITVVFSANSGYSIDAHSVNGQNLNSGQTITVTEPLEIVITALSNYNWKQVFVGSKDVTTNTTITTFDRLPLKYRASVTTNNEYYGYEYSQTVELDVDEVKTVYGKWETGGGDIEDEPCGTLKITQSISNLRVTAYATFGGRTGANDGDPYTMKITKLEVYN